MTKATITCVKKKKKQNKTGFQFVCTCGPNTRLKFQIENRKIERGIAEMPFSPFFTKPLDLYIESNFGNIS